jgi:hypothetical protein
MKCEWRGSWILLGDHSGHRPRLYRLRVVCETDSCYSYAGGSFETNAGGSPASLITNADQGILLSFQSSTGGYQSSTYTYNIPGTAAPPALQSTQSSGSGTTTQYLATISTGGDVTLSELNVPGQQGPVQPVLQRADGSYIGNVSTSNGNPMIAFTSSGSTLWTGPNDTPQIATSGGGVIGASGNTYDQNGNVSGQLASLPAQSWTGSSYQLGSIEQVADTPLIVASLWAWQGGNPGGTTTAGRPWYFILIWQNDFTFTPYNPNLLPSLTTNITANATAIKTAALANLSQAYAQLNVPVTAVEGTPGTGDDRATVLNRQTLSSDPDCGATSTNQFPRETDSQVDYSRNMQNAQSALGVVITNAQSETAALQQANLIQAIGRGIGTYAAHEIAHHFLGFLFDMDSDPAVDPAARGTYNGPFCQGGFDPSPWTEYWPNPVIQQHWEKPAQDALQKCLSQGWKTFSSTNVCYQ